MIPLVIVLKNGVVDEATIFQNEIDAETRFITENVDRGRDTNSDELDNGYVELEDATICLTWASFENNVTFKKILDNFPNVTDSQKLKALLEVLRNQPQIIGDLEGILIDAEEKNLQNFQLDEPVEHHRISAEDF